MIQYPSVEEIELYLKMNFPAKKSFFWDTIFGNPKSYYDILDIKKPIQELKIFDLEKHIVVKIFIKNKFLQSYVWWGRHLGSYGIFSYNGINLNYLSSIDKENLSLLFKEEAKELIYYDCYDLSNLLIEVFLNKKNYNHVIVSNIKDIENFFYKNLKLEHLKYIADMDSSLLHVNDIYPPTILESSNGWCVRFVTLAGNAHEVQNLGIEQFSISNQFKIEKSERIVLTEQAFIKVPFIIL